MTHEAYEKLLSWMLYVGMGLVLFNALTHPEPMSVNYIGVALLGIGIVSARIPVRNKQYELKEKGVRVGDV